MPVTTNTNQMPNCIFSNGIDFLEINVLERLRLKIAAITIRVLMEITLELGLQEYPNKKWQINRGELLEIDNQHIDWKEIESLP